jgi:hypothetical protein
MAHHHHRHLPGRQPPPDKLALPLRLLSGLLGLTLGFLGGQFLANPLKRDLIPPKKAVAAAAGIPPVGAPLQDRVAAVARMDEDALAGVLAAVQDHWVRRSEEAGAKHEAMFHLKVIFSRWTDLSGSRALKAALSLKEAILGDLALEALMGEWGLRDPLSASQSLTLIPWSSSQVRAALALVRGSVKRSPAEGLSIATRLVAGAPYIRRGAAAAEWLRQNPLNALRHLFDEPGISATIPAGLALGQWLNEDPAAFLNWHRREMGGRALPLLRFTSGTITPATLARLATVLTKEHGTLEAGLQWLHSAAGTAAQPFIFALSPADKAMNMEMQAWMTGREALPPASTALGWLPRHRHAASLNDLLPRLAIPDPAAGLRMLMAMPEADNPATMAPAVVRWWLEQAPATASAQIFAGDLNHPVGKAAASAAVEGLITSDPLQALDSLAKLPLTAEDIAAHRATAFHQLALSRPQAMLDWVTAHPDIPVPQEPLVSAVKNFAVSDGARAQQWVENTAPAALRPMLTGAIFELRLRRDRDEALAFLDSLPAGAERDGALAALATADIELSRRDHFFAANLLPDTFAKALQTAADADRLTLLRALLAAMKETGVATAGSLAHPHLRPADRTALQR